MNARKGMIVSDYYLLSQYMITDLNQAMLFVCDWTI